MKKNCSYCGEEILEVAIICKHCRSAITQPDKEFTLRWISPTRELHSIVVGRKVGRISKLGYVGITLGALLFSSGPLGRQWSLLPATIIGALLLIGSYRWARK